MRPWIVFAFLAPLAAQDNGPTADEIMARVAENQDRAVRARAEFVYRQNVAVRLRNTQNRLVREEISDFLVTPQEGRTHRDLAQFSGRYEHEGAMVSYPKSGYEGEGGFRGEADGHLAKNMCKELTGSEKSRDGLDPELFPLTARQQRYYRFQSKGKETYRGTPVYRVAFLPKKRGNITDSDDAIWKGEALVSTSDFEPLTISTSLAHGVPFWVKTALGTNLGGLGFSVSYQKFEDGVWFPVSYGTEFHVRVLYIYSRKVAISMTNSDFRRADVQSSVEFGPVQ